jgi:hypothetical protein
MFEQRFTAHSPQTNHCSPHLGSVRSWLPDFLKELSVPLEKFGTGRHKSFEDLVNEIDNGECRLSIDSRSGRIVRAGAVVRLDVRYQTKDGAHLQLYEAEQRFSDGRCRTRPTDFAVWEKLRIGEDPEVGMARALLEELKLRGEFQAIMRGDGTQIRRPPDDYPSIYSLFTAVDFTVNLSHQHFVAAGYQEDQRDKTTIFLWRPAQPLYSLR